MSADPKKARVLSAVYREANDVFVWTLLFDDGTEQVFCWPSIDLLKAVGIKGNATAEHLHGFCHAMEGKTINFVLEGIPQHQMPKETKADQQKMREGLAEHFETFEKHVRNQENGQA